MSNKVKYYLSESTGVAIPIKEMDSKHLYNARNVVKRTVITRLDKNGELINKGINQRLYDALNDELKTRPTQDYKKPIYILKKKGE
tara:strand:+ start:579 stop:836 length:258 start_codon:yes stop_codon:yes gene_type:complete